MSSEQHTPTSSHHEADPLEPPSSALETENGALLQHIDNLEKKLEWTQHELHRALHNSAAKDEYMKSLTDKYTEIRERYHVSLTRLHNRDDLILYLRKELRKFYSAVAGLTSEEEVLTRGYDQAIAHVTRILIEKWAPHELEQRLGDLVRGSREESEEITARIAARVANLVLREGDRVAAEGGGLPAPSLLKTNSLNKPSTPSRSTKQALSRAASSPRQLSDTMRAGPQRKLVTAQNPAMTSSQPQQLGVLPLNLSHQALNNQPLGSGPQPLNSAAGVQPLAPLNMQGWPAFRGAPLSLVEFVGTQPGRRSRALFFNVRQGGPRERRVAQASSRTRTKRDASQIPGVDSPPRPLRSARELEKAMEEVKRRSLKQESRKPSRAELTSATLASPVAREIARKSYPARQGSPLRRQGRAPPTTTAATTTAATPPNNNNQPTNSSRVKGRSHSPLGSRRAGGAPRVLDPGTRLSALREQPFCQPTSLRKTQQISS